MKQRQSILGYCQTVYDKVITTNDNIVCFMNPFT